MKKYSIHILYVSQYFPPEMGAPSARVYELSRRWVESGAKVTVLTAFPNHPTGIIPKEYRGYKYLEEEKDGIRVIRTYIYAAPNKGVIRRSLSYFSFLCSAIVQGPFKVGNPDIVIGTSPQFLVGIAGYILSKIKRVPFIFEVRDLWPESIVQLGLVKNRLIIHFLETIETFLYRKSRHIIGVADSTVKILSEKGIPKKKISIIKNGVDLSIFDKNKVYKPIPHLMQHKEKFIVSYIGTMGLSHALDKVLDTANLLSNEEGILFLLVGEGAEKENLKTKAAQLNLTNVVFNDQIDKKSLPAFYLNSNIVLVTLRNLPLFKKVIPSKLFEIMAMAKPIVITVDGEARELVKNAGSGIFVEPENPKYLAEAIIRLRQQPELCKGFGEQGFSFVRKYFDREKLADDYLKILRKMITVSSK